MKRKRETGSTVKMHLSANDRLWGLGSRKADRLRGGLPGNKNARTTRRPSVRQNQAERERDKDSDVQ